MPARLPDSERRALRAEFDPIDARNRSIALTPRPPWTFHPPPRTGHTVPLPAGIIAPVAIAYCEALGRPGWTPRLVGRWLGLRIYGLSHRALEKLKSRPPEREWTPEALAETYRDEAHCHGDPVELVAGWARHDPDAVTDLYIEARRRIEPFVTIAPSVALPPLGGLTPPEPGRTADVMGERLTALMEMLEPYGAPDAPEGEAPPIAADPVQDRKDERDKSDAPEARMDLVTLNQAAGMVHRSKRSLEHYKTLGKLPDPDVEGGAGKPHLYDWKVMRPWLEKTFGFELPESFPANRPNA